MKELWIAEDYEFELQPAGFYSFYISKFEEIDYQVENKELLLEMITQLDTFPLYVFMEAYDDDENEIRSFLNEKGLYYHVENLKEKRQYMTDGKTFTYHPPLFQIEIISIDTLEWLLEKTYYLALQNQFYGISLRRKLHFNHEGVFSVPILSDTTFKIGHDGQGFEVYSNSKNLKSLSDITKLLPVPYKIVQINDKEIL
ncbi:hypothetical protein [Sutcliffiella rhizosphaerae]|uniref:Uncharacterized protein n=1 Tax=Sutcliffiella rhizosphaerae TaxID=2880967 RepID=A0ABN8ADJ7_9BACI|nr:hypothetical protein [Sutcliffiella rhizosphaerae]CAG9622157.1 hypothetical protein BACCIP111883_02948 [Sutcliffiella rhizosphaerae]